MLSGRGAAGGGPACKRRGELPRSPRAPVGGRHVAVAHGRAAGPALTAEPNGTFTRSHLEATCGSAVEVPCGRLIRPYRPPLPHPIPRDGMFVSRPRFGPRKTSWRSSLGELRPQAPSLFSRSDFDRALLASARAVPLWTARVPATTNVSHAGRKSADL